MLVHQRGACNPPLMPKDSLVRPLSVLGVSWCYGSYCWLAVVSQSWYCLLFFESFVFRHFGDHNIHSTKKLPLEKGVN